MFLAQGSSFGLFRVVFLVEDGYGVLLLSLVFFPSLELLNPRPLLRLVSTLIVLANNVERCSVAESGTVLVLAFTVLLTGLFELTDLVRSCAVVFVEAPLRLPFFALVVPFCASVSEDRLLLRVLPNSSVLVVRRFFFVVSPRLELRVDAARLV